MLSTKNYNNNSSLFANTGKFNSIEADNIYNKTGVLVAADIGVEYITDYIQGRPLSIVA